MARRPRREMFSASERAAIAVARFLLCAVLAALLFALVWALAGYPLNPTIGTLWIVIPATCGGVGVIWGDGFVRGLGDTFQKFAGAWPWW
ncbi:MAG: hypothetical protein WD534_07730 [Phycisphaeraceae bacterium]